MTAELDRVVVVFTEVEAEIEVLRRETVRRADVKVADVVAEAKSASMCGRQRDLSREASAIARIIKLEGR